MNISSTPATNAAVLAETNITVAKKALDAQKIEGRAAVGLIETAGAVAENANRATQPAAADGTGRAVDVTV